MTKIEVLNCIYLMQNFASFKPTYSADELVGLLCAVAREVAKIPDADDDIQSGNVVIKYESRSDGLCVTPCPNGMKTKDGRIILVGTSFCGRCKHQVYQSNNTVCCNCKQ